MNTNTDMGREQATEQLAEALLVRACHQEFYERLVEDAMLNGLTSSEAYERWDHDRDAELHYKTMLEDAIIAMDTDWLYELDSPRQRRLTDKKWFFFHLMGRNNKDIKGSRSVSAKNIRKLAIRRLRNVSE
jgi:hypothetical protein